MLAIFKRDLRGFFTSPIGYVFLALFLMFMNFMFILMNVQSYQSSEIGITFSVMMYALMVVIPLLTMRLLSEEMRQKTDQLLLTAPVNVYEIVLGKFFASFAVFALALVGTLTWPLIVTMYGNPAAYSIIGNYVAILFAASTFISIGIFVSSLTESQIIAYIVTIAFYLGFLAMSMLTSVIDVPLIQSILNWVSIFSRYQNFAMGLFSLADIVYYLSVSVIFLFLTTRVLEKKRWA